MPLYFLPYRKALKSRQVGGFDHNSRIEINKSRNADPYTAQPRSSQRSTDAINYAHNIFDHSLRPAIIDRGQGNAFNNHAFAINCRDPKVRAAKINTDRISAHAPES